MAAAPYDPFLAGSFRVGVRTLRLRDTARGRVLPCALWHPCAPGENGEPLPGPWPLVVYSHRGGGNGRSATFLCGHLASHGYAVAAPDHSEVVVPELTARPGETAAEREARVATVVAGRVPDVRLALARLLDGDPATAAGGVGLDAARVGLVGHSFGGWTVLATPDTEPRVRAVVAMAPAGSSRPRPGILPVTLDFAWTHTVATLVLAGDEDVMTPLDGIVEVFRRMPAPKRMFVLRGADHLHFGDDAEEAHESLRRFALPGDAAWIPSAMRPVAKLCPPDDAHAFARGLALAHLDASLRDSRVAGAWLADHATQALSARGIDAWEQRGPAPPVSGPG